MNIRPRQVSLLEYKHVITLIVAHARTYACMHARMHARTHARTHTH